MLLSCITPIYKVGDAWKLTDEARLTLVLSDGIKLQSVDGKIESPYGSGGHVAFIPGKYKLTLGFLDFNKLGTTEYPQVIDVTFEGRSGETYYGCVEKNPNRKFNVNFAKAIADCKGAFVVPGTGFNKGADVEETYFHGDAAFQDPTQLVRVKLSSNSRLTSVSDQYLMQKEYEVVYVLPKKTKMGISLNEHRGNQWTYSIMAQDVTIDGTPGSEFFVCSEILPDSKWKPIVSTEKFGCTN